MPDFFVIAVADAAAADAVRFLGMKKSVFAFHSGLGLAAAAHLLLLRFDM